MESTLDSSLVLPLLLQKFRAFPCNRLIPREKLSSKATSTLTRKDPKFWSSPLTIILWFFSVGKSRQWRKTGKRPLPHMGTWAEQVSSRREGAPDCTVQMGLRPSPLKVSPSTWSNVSGNAAAESVKRDPSYPTGVLVTEQKWCWADEPTYLCLFPSSVYAHCQATWSARLAFLGLLQGYCGTA